MAPERIVLCRIGRAARELEIVSPATIDRLRSRSGGDAGPPLFDSVSRALRFAFLRSLRWARRQAMRAGVARPPFSPTRGDVVLAMGGTWSNPGFATAVTGLKNEYGVRLVHLVHDLLPATHPDLVADRQVARFARWIDDIARLADAFLTPSHHVAAELQTFLAGRGRGNVPVTPVVFGAGFSATATGVEGKAEFTRPFVMFVSTIEVRKNHLFLARVWQRLVERHGADAIPTLLVVGRFGWKTQPFQRFLTETGNLSGKIIVRSGLSDLDLDRAYDQCLFTVFPSLCEGWGLPVAESLAHGRACVAAATTSIPEVGGDAADYFDPRDEASTVAAIERMLFEPGYRQAREDWIRANHRPRSWADAAATILDAIDSRNADTTDAHR